MLKKKMLMLAWARACQRPGPFEQDVDVQRGDVLARHGEHELAGDRGGEMQLRLGADQRVEADVSLRADRPELPLDVHRARRTGPSSR